MTGVRRALALASLGKYSVIAIGMIATLVVARLMAPAEFGVYVVGGAVLMVAEALRELGSVAYIVQQPDLTRDKIRTTFTVSLLVTIVVGGGLLLLAPALARFYKVPGLAAFVRISAIGYLLGPFVHPIYALLSRNLRFGRLALIDMATATLNAAASILLVLMGRSYIGLAYANLLSGAAGMILCQLAQRDSSIFRPSLREWRSVLSFGVHGSAAAVIARANESFSYLMVGKLIAPRASGLLQRAVLLATVPDRILLAGAGAVALPALSQEARGGRKLADAYLRALAHLSAIQWPALLLLALLAKPLVAVLLGPRWYEVVPLVRIMALSCALAFPLMLNSASQVAAGGIRHLAPVSLLQAAISLPVLFVVAPYGLDAIALSTLATAPATALISTAVARRHVGFRWRDVPGAVAGSGLVALSASIGPLILVAAAPSLPPLAALAAGGLLGVGGMLAGLALTGHPLQPEVRRLFALVRQARRIGTGRPRRDRVMNPGTGEKQA